MGGIDGKYAGLVRICWVRGVSAGNFKKVPERLGILRKVTESIRICQKPSEK